MVDFLHVKDREPLNQSAAAGSFAPTFRFENLEIRKGFPNLNLEQDPLLVALAISSEVP